MLIQPNGRKKWQKKIEKWSTGRHDGRKLPIETGYPVLKSEDRYPSVTPEKLRYVLPNWFCVDCSPQRGPRKPSNEQGVSVHLAPDSIPGLDLKRGEVIVYYLCPECIHKELWGKKEKKAIKLTDDSQEKSMSIKRWETAIDFLRSLNPDDRTKITPVAHWPVQ